MSEQIERESEAQIRRATVADAEQLAPFAARVFHETFAADSNPDDMALYLATVLTPARFAEEIADPQCAFFLAHVRGVLAGYLKLRTGYLPDCVTDPTALELSRLYVAREWHGRGIAHDLMRLTLAFARENDHRSIWLGVWDRNPRARAFYAKWNFREIGSHPFQFGTELQSDLVCIRPV